MHHFKPKPINLAQIPVDYKPYDGAELRRNPGIPDGRFRAYSLPSLRHGRRVEPRLTMLREGEEVNHD